MAPSTMFVCRWARTWSPCGSASPRGIRLYHTFRISEDLRKETGGPIPGDWTVDCYDSVWILKKAIEKAKSTDPKAIMKAIEGMEFEGAAGWVRIRPSPICRTIRSYTWDICSRRPDCPIYAESGRLNTQRPGMRDG